MSKGNGKKQGIAENFKPVESLFRRFIPGLLLAAFVLLSMASLLSIQRLQGDARTINYAGIVRGATQRLIKQEMNAVENDELIGTLDGILTGLSAGGGEYQLTVLHSLEFQSDLSAMEKSWTRIKEEIYQVRGGADTRTLYELSESYFSLTNQAVSAAEAYSEQKVLSSTRWISLLNGVFVLVAVLLGIYQSRQKKVYQEPVSYTHLDVYKRQVDDKLCILHSDEGDKQPDTGGDRMFQRSRNGVKKSFPHMSQR